jgi:subtilisin family serine protease
MEREVYSRSWSSISRNNSGPAPFLVEPCQCRLVLDWIMHRLLVLLTALLLSVPLVALGSAGGVLVSTAYADDDDDGGGRGRGSVGSGGGSSAQPEVFFGRLPVFRPGSFFRPGKIFRLKRPRAQRPAAPPPVAAPSEIVAVEVSTAALNQIAADGFTIVARAPLSLIGGEVARLRPPSGVGLEAVRQRILQIAPGAIVDENHIYRPVVMPCNRDACPAFEMIGWVKPPARCDLSVSIGMIDTAVNPDHEALRAQAVEIVSVMSEGDRASAASHGTAIAALLVGDDASRTPGLLPGARLIAVEAFHRDRAGDASDAYKLVRALDALNARGIRVVNMSFAGPANLPLERAVSRAGEEGMILVAAAGNRGANAPPAYPAAYPSVIAVTAVDRTGKIFRQAGQGEHIAFAAPGVRLWTAASVSGGRYRSGTSYAVPFVAAAAAAALAATPGRTAAGVVEALSALSDDLGEAGRDPVFGWGLVKAASCPAGPG